MNINKMYKVLNNLIEDEYLLVLDNNNIYLSFYYSNFLYRFKINKKSNKYYLRTIFILLKLKIKEDNNGRD